MGAGAVHHHDDHDDHHAHHHAHAPANMGVAFALGMALNAGFVVLEVVFGLFGHSVALLADAGHNLSDVLGLGVAWLAVILGRRAPTIRFTYGLGGTSILAALFNAVFLLVVTGGLTWEALRRFFEPEPVAGKTVMIVAACGILINGFCAWLFSAGRGHDLNVRGAFMHMAADALVSLGVVAAGGVILLTGWHWLDPLTSLLINAVIIWGTWGLLTGALAMSVNAVPPHVDLPEVRALLLALPGVEGVHDLHVWPLSTTETALTCHLVVPNGHTDDEWLTEAVAQLAARFGINHVTLQPECSAPTAEHLAATHNY
jgi:cobalt-zinc-cadmium efflux system protein